MFTMLNIKHPLNKQKNFNKHLTKLCVFGYFNVFTLESCKGTAGGQNFGNTELKPIKKLKVFM